MAEKETWTISSLKEHYDERFRALENRFELADKAILSALEAKDKLSAAIHAASKEAITKAEDAQKQYNTIHNDLVRKNELMQTRADAEKDQKNVADKLEAQRVHFEDKIESRFKELVGKIEPLESSSEAGGGRRAGIKEFRDWVPWLITIGMFLAYIFNLGKK